MKPIYLLLIAVFGVVMGIIGTVLKNKRANNPKYIKILEDFRKSVSNMLEPGEEVIAVCGYRPCAAATNQRLLVSAKNGVDSIPYANIKKVKGMDTAGNKTTDPFRMIAVTVKAEKKYTLGNHSEGFAQVVSAVYKHTNL